MVMSGMENHLPLSRLDPKLSDDQRNDWAIGLAAIAIKAARAILAIEQNMPIHSIKTDGSPVTVADQAAEDIILGELAQEVPWLSVIAEEQAAAGVNVSADRIFALVDPLDGTKEFLSRNGEYSVNIALIRDGKPVAGVIVAPALGKIWLGGQNAFAADLVTSGGAISELDPDQLRPIHCRNAPEAITVVSSRSHPSEETERFLDAYRIGEQSVAGSSLKFCAIAEGRADLYPRFGPTMEWDTAAGHAILVAAGGNLCQPSGADFLYGKKGSSWRNGHFIAYGDPRLHPSE